MKKVRTQYVSFEVAGKSISYVLNKPSTAAALQWITNLFPNAKNVTCVIGR